MKHVPRAERGAWRNSSPRAAPALVCVLELSLPDTPGLDLLRELRREHPGVTFLALSEQVAPHEIVAALKLGAADFVAKPVDPARFRLQVRNAVQDAFHARELDRAKAEAGDGLTTMRLDQILQKLVLRGGSDLHLKVGRPPLMRLAGDLVPTELPEIRENDMKGLLLQMLGREGLTALEAHFECDTSYLLPGVARFRVNAFRRMGQFGAALRLIPLAAPTIEAMGLKGT